MSCLTSYRIGNRGRVLGLLDTWINIIRPMGYEIVGGYYIPSRAAREMTDSQLSFRGPHAPKCKLQLFYFIFLIFILVFLRLTSKISILVINFNVTYFNIFNFK